MKRVRKILTVSTIAIAVAFSASAKNDKPRRPNAILYKLKQGVSPSESDELQFFIQKYKMKLEEFNE